MPASLELVFVIAASPTCAVSAANDNTGCNNCKFLTLAKQLPSLTYLAGVDIDRQILDVSKQRLCPLAADYLDGRKMADLVVEVWAGDVTNEAGAEVMTNRVEAVTSIEIIEHLQR